MRIVLIAALLMSCTASTIDDHRSFTNPDRIRDDKQASRATLHDQRVLELVQKWCGHLAIGEAHEGPNGTDTVTITCKYASPYDGGDSAVQYIMIDKPSWWDR